MGKKYLLDSNVIIDYLDNKLPSDGMIFLNDIVNEIPNISVISKIEVLRFNSNQKTYTILTNFIDVCVIQKLENDIVDKTIYLCKKYKIKLPDAIIAATAITHNYILISRNISDFRKIIELETINPHDL